MRFTARGRALAATAAVVLLAILGFVLFAGGGKGPRLIAQAFGGGHASPPPPATCPLTGTPAPGGVVPHRPALAIKVENLPQARPQTGLNFADVVYEEPVEAGITRFIAIFQCREAPRVEPVRSGRMEDPVVLVQYDHPLFGYAGAVPEVMAAVKRAGIHDVNFDVEPSAYLRDPARIAPHNLYTSTAALWAYAPKGQGAPPPVFTFQKTPPAGGQPAASIHLPFSVYSDVTWRYAPKKDVWFRYYNGTVPANLSNGSVISARNVVVMVVRVTLSAITDVNGVHSPYAHLIGSGPAYVLRNGRVYKGRWVRPSMGSITKYVDAQGNVIPLAPGTTWVELLPSTVPVTLSK